METYGGCLAHRLNLTNWADISVTLPANLVADNGLCIIEEDPNLHSSARAMVGDLDVSAS